MIITKKEVLWIILIVVAAFLIRFMFFSLHSVVELDGAYYISLGKNLIEDGLYRDLENNLNTNLTPGMPIAIGLVNLIFNDGVLSARIVSALFGALLIIPVYLFTKRIYSRKEAVIAGILTASYSILVYISTLTYNDSLYLFLLITGLYLGWLSLKKEKLWMYVLTGILFSFSYLTRPEGFLIPFVFVLYYLLVYRKYEFKGILKLVLMLIVFLLVSMPWLYFIHENTNKWQITTKGGFTYLQREYKVFTDEYEKNLFSLNDEKTRIRLNPYNFTGDTSTSTYVLQDINGFAKRYFSNFVSLVFNFFTSIFPIIFLLILIYGLLEKKDRSLEAYLLIFLLYPLLISPVFGNESRWLLILVPILLIGVSRGITRLDNLNKKLNYRFITILLAVLMIVAVLFVNQVVDKNYEKNDQPIEHKIAGEWLKINAETGGLVDQQNKTNQNILVKAQSVSGKDYIFEGKTIMERRPWVSFYSGGRFVYLPYADYEDTIGYGCKNKVDFLVVDSRYLERLRPQLKNLLNDNFRDLDLTYTNNVNGKILKIFKLKCLAA